MNKYLRYTAVALLSGTIAACSSDDDGAAGVQDDAGTTDSGSTDAGSTTDGSTDSGTTGGGSASGGSTPVGPIADDATQPVTTLRPVDDPNDPFGFSLETDPEASNGTPTMPKNLRVDLISNNWAEMSWAPSNDDGSIVSYRVHRSDGHIYDLTAVADEVVPSGTQAEMDKYLSTTSFIDCNRTRFLDRVHDCGIWGPNPGDTFAYQVSAVDDDGNESGLSNEIFVTYHEASGAPVSNYSDFYLNPDDRFARSYDLADSSSFLDQLELVFEDDFDGPTIDSEKWNTQLVWADTRIINGEMQYFVNSQDEPEFGYQPFSFGSNEAGDSVLHIEAIPTPAELTGNLPDVCNEEDPLGNPRCIFLSGALSSHDKFAMTYGYVEGRMKVGGTPGMLSSFYLYHRYEGQNTEATADTEARYLRNGPEIDIVEFLGENPFGDPNEPLMGRDAFQTYHFSDVNTGLTRSSPTMSYKNPQGELYSNEFHTYGVLWEPQLVIWYIDGKEIKRLTGPLVGRQGMNIVTYLVAGSGWAPEPDRTDADIFPLQLDIDYIRAYQRREYTCNGVYPEPFRSECEAPPR